MVTRAAARRATNGLVGRPCGGVRKSFLGSPVLLETTPTQYV
jgi:hypothetical protein